MVRDLLVGRPPHEIIVVTLALKLKISARWKDGSWRSFDKSPANSTTDDYFTERNSSLTS